MSAGGLVADARVALLARSPDDALASLACSGQALAPPVKTWGLRDDAPL